MALAAKADSLVSKNEYFATLADLVTQVSDVNCMLGEADERDKHSMALLGVNEESSGVGTAEDPSKVGQ